MACCERSMQMEITERTRNGVTFFGADGIDAAGGAAHGLSLIHI